MEVKVVHEIYSKGEQIQMLQALYENVILTGFRARKLDSEGSAVSKWRSVLSEHYYNAK
ncbi:hypothetical protein [Shouchella patagoniensis]|uniref:hypothetical protein n=1 Tax=Shouchella patagoniensis TaxID=228576 RepID=UPI0014758977|nr:hypothetical protein [Shouchella patagoniensis]